MRQQIKQYLDQQRYSNYQIPIQRNQQYGVNVFTKFKSLNSQYSKQSTVQIQDFSMHNQQEEMTFKNNNQDKLQSNTNIVRNRDGSVFNKEGGQANDTNIKNFSHSPSKESLKYPNGINTEQASNYSQQGNGYMQNRVGYQKSKIFNNQSSHRFLTNYSNDLHSHNKSSLNNPSTIIFAFQEKILIEQEEIINKKRKKIKDVLLGKSREEVFAKGLRHFRDAHLLRPPRNLFDRDQIMLGKYFLYFYELRWTIWWSILQKALSYLFIIQTFVEPQTLADSFNDPSIEQYVYGQEILILLFCLADNILSLYIYRSSWRNNFFKIFSYISQFAIFITFFVDFIIFWHFQSLGIRFSAVLRPVWLIQFHSDIFHTLKSIFMSFRKVIDIFLFFICFSCFWGYMGYNLFSEYSDQFLGDKYFVFGSVGESILGMYTLISMDTYPAIMKNIVIDNPYYLIFFVPYVCINLFFLLFIPVAVIFENYKHQRALLILQDDKIIKEALTFSFFCITHYNQEDYITKDQFFNLINSCISNTSFINSLICIQKQSYLNYFILVYHNKGIREKIDNLYCILNIDQLEQLTLAEFLDVIDMIKSSERLYDNSNKYWDAFREYCNRYFHFDQIGRSYYWNYFILFIVTVNTIMIIVYSIITVDTQDDNLDNLLTNIDIFFNTIYIIDVIVKIIGFGINEYFADYWNNFDFIMVMISIITIFGIKYIYFLKQAKSTKLIKITKLQRVLKIFRSIRTLKLFKILKLGADALLRVQKLFHKVALCIPSIYGFLYTYFLFSFSYAIIGTYLFNTQYNSYKEGSPYDDNNYTDFNSLQNALLALLQIISQSRWVEFLYGYGYKFDLPLATAYFCFYHMFSILFFMSLLKGMIWDVFNVVENYFKEQEIDELIKVHNMVLNTQHSNQQFEEQGGIHNDIISHKERFQTLPNNEEVILQFQHTNKIYGQMNKDDDDDNKVPIRRVSNYNHLPQLKQNEQKSPKDSNNNEEKTQSNNQDRLLSLPLNDNFQQSKMSSYHYMKKDMNYRQQKYPSVAEEKEFDYKEEVEEVDEEKSSISKQSPQEKSKKKFFPFIKKSSQEDSAIQMRSINPHSHSKVNKNYSMKDTECDDIAEEEIRINNNGEVRERITSEENRFIIRFNGGEESSNTLGLLSPKQISSQPNSPQSIYPHKNSENDNLLYNYNDQIIEQKLKSPLANNLTISTGITPQFVDSAQQLIENKEEKNDSPEPFKQSFDEKDQISHLKINTNFNRKNSISVNFQSRSSINQLSPPHPNLLNVNSLSPNTNNGAKKSHGSILKRSESSFISREQDKFITTAIENTESDFDKYIKKRMNTINYEVDLIAQMNQLEMFLQLYDQVGLKQAELRKNRIVAKHQNLNHFSISKQHALNKMTFLKDHPLNFNYVNRQDYLQATEQLLGFPGNIQTAFQFTGGRYSSANRAPAQQNPNFVTQMYSRYYSTESHQKVAQNGISQIRSGQNNNQNISINLGNNNQLPNPHNFITLSDIDDVDSQNYKDKTQKQKQNQQNLNLSEETCYPQGINNRDHVMNDQTFLRLNNIFSFLLHLLTNISHFDNQFIIQKLFIIEQSINQVIFGNYNESHKINHFKFVFYSPSQNKFMVLIKQYDILDSKNEIFDTQQNLLKVPIEVCSVPNEITPWSAFTKSMQKENQIYFIKSLFSNIESEMEKEIANKLSQGIQFMRGYEYCQEDLTKYEIEQYSSFIYSRQTAVSQFNPQQRSFGSSQPYIGFICNKQQKEKTNNKLPKSNLKVKIQNRRQDNYKDRAQSPESLQNRFQYSKNISQKSIISPEVAPANLKLDAIIGEQFHSVQKATDTLKIIRQKTNYRNQQSANNEIKIIENRITEEEKQQTYVVGNTKNSIEARLQAPKNQSPNLKSNLSNSSPIDINGDRDKKSNNRQNITQIIDQRNQIKLRREQEHTIKIYHQIQQFFSSHSHLLQAVIVRLQALVSQHIPGYEQQ